MDDRSRLFSAFDRIPDGVREDVAMQFAIAGTAKHVGSAIGGDVFENEADSTFGLGQQEDANARLLIGDLRPVTKKSLLGNEPLRGVQLGTDDPQRFGGLIAFDVADQLATVVCEQEAGVGTIGEGLASAVLGLEPLVEDIAVVIRRSRIRITAELFCQVVFKPPGRTLDSEQTRRVFDAFQELGDAKLMGDERRRHFAEHARVSDTDFRAKKVGTFLAE